MATVWRPVFLVASSAAVVLLGAITCAPGGSHVDPARTVQPLGTIPGTSAPDPATDVLRRFAATYRARSVDDYVELLTEDYLFRSPSSAGTPRSCSPLDVTSELLFASAFFGAGSGGVPGATLARVIFDGDAVAVPDPNHLGADPAGRWHRAITTGMVLHARFTDHSALDTRSVARFALIRGDSALIPEELRLRGFGPDSTRWWIRRWDDVTLAVAGAVAQTPTDLYAPGALRRAPRAMNWLDLKTRYLGPCIGPATASR